MRSRGAAWARTKLVPRGLRLSHRFGSRLALSPSQSQGSAVSDRFLCQFVLDPRASRRRALSSGLTAHEKAARMTQAALVCRKAVHTSKLGARTQMSIIGTYNCDLRLLLVDPGSRDQCCSSFPHRMTYKESRLPDARRRLRTSGSRKVRACTPALAGDDSRSQSDSVAKPVDQF